MFTLVGKIRWYRNNRFFVYLFFNSEQKRTTKQKRLIDWLIDWLIKLYFSTVKILAQRPTHISAVATVLLITKTFTVKYSRERQTDRQTETETETERELFLSLSKPITSKSWLKSWHGFFMNKKINEPELTWFISQGKFDEGRSLYTPNKRR